LEQIAKATSRSSRSNTRDISSHFDSPGASSLFRTTITRLLEPDEAATRAILFDDGSGHSLDTIELARVTEEIQKTIGQPLDMLGMDACLMANLEVAYELRKSVRTLVASQELVPAHSWPYEKIYSRLRANPKMEDADLARCVVSEYLEYYKINKPMAGDVTKVALDLTKMSPLIDAVNALAEGLKKDLDRIKDFIGAAQDKAKRQETRGDKRSPNKFGYRLWDLGSFARALAGFPDFPADLKERAEAVSKALERGMGTVLAEEHLGKWFEQIAGVSIYFPPEKEFISRFYPQLKFAQDTQWLGMLQKYHPTGLP
jgi:hypothetical protein